MNRFSRIIFKRPVHESPKEVGIEQTGRLPAFVQNYSYIISEVKVLAGNISSN